ncbi:MAG: ATP-dependent DNA ligase [Gemmatimonadetes bacterium]|nr:ATP-dependent DNA ligase [Gemmatimonadota bacterium]
MRLPIEPPYAPMEARLVDELPEGEGWLYEPKWDGFRCLVFRDRQEIALQSKSCKPLGRYFPEVVERFRSLSAERFVLDGELLVPVEGVLSFDDLLMRIHPAESRVRTLSRSFPAVWIAFDLLVDESGESWTERPFEERRERLETFAERRFGHRDDLATSPATAERESTAGWLLEGGASLDGAVAKRADAAYASGQRTAMVKVKRYRTADCVIGGFRYGKDSDRVGSLLLGLYDDDGALHHVGFTSGLKEDEKPELTERLESLRGGSGFDERVPGGPSRWSNERSADWHPVRPELVVEVRYDHFTGGRFRHGTRLLRWRPDKLPDQCTLDQVRIEGVRWREVLGAGGEGAVAG